MLRVHSNSVLVVPPFECAWLTGDEFLLKEGRGCLSFEVKGAPPGSAGVPGGRVAQGGREPHAARGASHATAQACSISWAHAKA